MEKNELTIGKIVANDFRTAAVFRNAGIDFCCGGNMSLEEACKKEGVDQDILEQELDALSGLPIDRSQNYKDWSPGFLCDYIVNMHHTYVKSSLPDLVFYTQKIASVHGDRHAELVEIASMVEVVNGKLLDHMKREEEVLFPAIKEALNGKGQGHARIIREQIDEMAGEHEFAGGTFDRIHEMTRGYQVPADGCNTYGLAFKLLREFEDDLHIHVHLENNILFPKALELG